MSNETSHGRRLAIRGLACTVAAASALLAGAAQADCRLSLQPSFDQWLINYDPFDQEDVASSFDIAVTNIGDTACEGTISIDLQGEAFGLSQAGDSQRVPYAIIDESAGTDLTPRAGRSARRLNARPVSLAPGDRTMVRFAFAASPGGMVKSGVYDQDAFISVQNGAGMPLAERAVNLAVNVVPAAVMGLKGAFQRSNGVATIDLGDLTTGTRSLDTTLYVLSTGGYSVSVSSKNQGQLRHSAGDWAIGYGLGIGEHQMSLSSPREITVTSSRARFDDYPLSVSIGSVAGKRAGDYSDTITFTVAAI